MLLKITRHAPTKALVAAAGPMTANVRYIPSGCTGSVVAVVESALASGRGLTCPMVWLKGNFKNNGLWATASPEMQCNIGQKQKIQYRAEAENTGVGKC